MSSIQFLHHRDLSSYQLKLNATIIVRISEADKYWIEIIKPIITLPYVYEVTGLGKNIFSFT